MDKHSRLIFEAYKNKMSRILSEAPVELAGDVDASTIKADFPAMSKGKYDLTPEETARVYKTFLDSFKSSGGKSPKLYKDFYEIEIAPVVRAVKPSINSTNSKYTARVLYNAMKAARVVKDERDGVELKKSVTQKGAENLASYTLKNAEKLGKEVKGKEVKGKEVSAGSKIDDPIMKRFWERILGEGEYTKEELQRMIIEDNPDMEESEARTNISGLIMSGYVKKTGTSTYEAVDPEEESEKEEKEGEGTGEVTSGYDPEELDDIDNDPYGGVYIGPTRGSGSMD